MDRHLMDWHNHDTCIAVIHLFILKILPYIKTENMPQEVLPAYISEITIQSSSLCPLFF